MNQPILMKAAPGSGVPAGQAESRNGKKFQEMDRLGRGPGSAEYWKKRGIAQKLAYARWLARDRGISCLSEFRKIAPEPIYRCVCSSDENRRKAGLIPKQKRPMVESADNPLTAYLREHGLLKKDIHTIPPEKYVALCRAGVSLFGISSRRDFGRFFPQDAVIRNRKEGLWGRIGLEDKRHEGKAPSTKSKKEPDKTQNPDLPGSAKDEFTGDDFLELFDEQDIQGESDSEPESIFEDPKKLDSYIPEAPETSSPAQGNFRGSPARGPLLSDSNSLPRHEENVRMIFHKLITWSRCSRKEKPRLKKTLFMEIQKGDPERAARLFCRVGMPPDEKDAAGQTVLHRAAEHKNPEVLRQILKIGETDPNLQDSMGNTPLMAAATEDRANSISILYSNGARLDQRNDSKQTALMLAAWEGNTQSVRVLLSIGANPLCRDTHKKNAADYAALEGHTQIERLIRNSSRKKPGRKKGKDIQDE